MQTTATTQTAVTSTGNARETSRARSEEENLASFGRALDQLHAEVEAKLGADDVAHIRRVGALSRTLEIVGRGLIHFSVEPASFSLGVSALWAHKCLELMEIGHMALHGAFDHLEGAERYASESFRWKAPIDEASWRAGHNLRHHGYTNIEGSDPDMSFAVLRLSSRVPYRRMHRLQPISNLFTWFGFGTAIQLHVTGMLRYLELDAKDASPDPDKAVPHSRRGPSTHIAQPSSRAAVSKLARYYAREYILFPALAGPFFWKTLLGNALSEVGRDVYSAATIYCGHVGAKDYPRGTRPKGRARWYLMQAEGSRNFEVPYVLSVLSGGLDKQIEHHLFPRLPPNRLREIAPRVREICEQHGVTYLSSSWPSTLRDVAKRLYAYSRPVAGPTGSDASGSRASSVRT